MIAIENYIGGAFAGARCGDTLDVVEPATGEIFAQVPDSGTEDIQAAAAAAREAAPDWSRRPASERAAHLNRLADLVDRDLKSLAAAESRDNGKLLRLAETLEIPRVATNLRFFAGLIQGFASQAHPMPDAINYTLRQPLGVVGCISPWNLPLYLFSWKVAPALAAGNCVVAKPSEITPLTAYLFSRLCHEAGLPDGVLNVVHGSGSRTGNAMLVDPHIRAISFTGGTQTGRHIAEVVAPQFKKLSLEMGGKNPNILFEDGPYESLLETTLRSSFSNQGQICLCGSRILVEQSLMPRFREDFVARAAGLKVGDPLEATSDLGAVVSRAHQEKILGCIERARREGGRVLCGGEAVRVGGRCAGGFFVQPTVIEGLETNCRTLQEEIFGPVVTLQTFSDDEEALRMANGTPYGLSASIWTSDLTRAHRLAEQVEAGVVWINCWLVRDLRTPFGGVKQSGMGREGGWEALRFFTEPKNVCVHY